MIGSIIEQLPHAKIVARLSQEQKAGFAKAMRVND
jgi:hypothetical protein